MEIFKKNLLSAKKKAMEQIDETELICGECGKNNHPREWYCRECDDFVIATYEEECNSCGSDLSESNCACEE